MFVSKRTVQASNGFTLMEMLVVIAIVAVLVGVAIPILGGQIENAQRATDESNARSALAAAEADYMANGKSGIVSYVFDASRGTVVDALESGSVEGYGQSESEADYEVGGFPVAGTPKTGAKRGKILVRIEGDTVSSIQWNDGYVKRSAAVTPQSMKSNTATLDERIASDIDILDAMQANIRTMTVKELLALNIQEGWQDNKKMLILSSADLNDNLTLRGGGAQNKVRVGAEPLFAMAGVDSSLLANGDDYTQTSIASGNSVHLVLYLPKSYDQYGDDELLSDAVVAAKAHDSNDQATAREYGIDYSSRKNS